MALHLKQKPKADISIFAPQSQRKWLYPMVKSIVLLSTVANAGVSADKMNRSVPSELLIQLTAECTIGKTAGENEIDR